MEIAGNDIDLLIWEPMLFREYGAAGQVVVEGDGATIDGVTLTDTGADFQTQGVLAGMVAHVWNAETNADDLLEVVAVDSETQLTVSRLRMSREGAPVNAMLTGTGMAYRVISYRRQIEETIQRLSRICGLDRSDGELVNSDVLRQVVALDTVVTILMGCGELDSLIMKRIGNYRRLYEQALESICLMIDLDGDGAADMNRSGRVIHLTRV